MASWIRSSTILAFAVLTHLGSWILWSPWWLAVNGVGLLPYELPFGAVALINQLGLFGGPLAAGLIVTGCCRGRAGLRRFGAAFVQFRAAGRWYALALIGIPLAVAIGYALTGGFGASAEQIDAVLLGALTGNFLIYLLGGPLQEEPGWRGVALPLLQHRHHPLTAALILGVLHCFWHAPLFTTAEWDTARSSAEDYIAYLLLILALTVVLSWLFTASGGSVVLAVLGHNSLNWAMLAAGVLTGAPATNWPAAIGLAVLAAAAIGITRGRLGHDPAAPADPFGLLRSGQ